MRIAISAQDLPAELARLQGDIGRAVHLGVKNSARRGRALLVRRTPKDQGNAKQAWRDTTTGAQTSGLIAEIFNDAPYIGVLEEGARPHPVSEEGQQAILEWVKRHLPAFIGHDRAAFIKRKFGNYADMEAKEIADAIVWKLRTKGQEPTYFIRDSLDELRGFVRVEIDHALAALASARRPV